MGTTIHRSTFAAVYHSFSKEYFVSFLIQNQENYLYLRTMKLRTVIYSLLLATHLRGDALTAKLAELFE